MDAPRLHVDVDGVGPCVLLAHGFGGSARNFGPQMRALKDRHRVVRYDARGHARSAAPTDPAAYSPEIFTDDMRRVLDDAGEATAVVGGLSMGAATALRFAAAHPDRTRGAILCAYPAPACDPRGFAGKALAFADTLERHDLEAAGEAYVWGPTTRLDPTAVRFVRQGFLQHQAHGLALTLRGVIAKQPSVATLRPTLARVRCPVLVVVGLADAPSLDACRALTAALPHATLVEIPGAGHVVNLQKPERVSALMREFLHGLRP